MKKIFFVTILALGMMSFVACSKKGSGSKSNYSCSMYPGTVTVTNPQQINFFMYQVGQGVRPPPSGNYYGGGNSGYNGYGTAYICVDQYVYSQYAGGAGGGGGGGNYSYCLQHPYDYQCQTGTYPPGGGNGGSCITVCDATGWCYCY